MLKYALCLSFYFIVSKSVLEYGEFNLTLTKIEILHGPKRKNCVETTVKIVNNVFLKYDFHVIEDMKYCKGKITGALNGKELVRIKIKNICDHIFFKPLVQSLLNMTDGCGILKGHYLFSADVQTIARSFYGDKFMYGNWKYNLMFYNDYCNMHCANLHLVLTPKFPNDDKTDKQLIKHLV